MSMANLTQTLTMRSTLGYLFTNRIHVFLMPVLPTLFANMVLQLPLPPSYYLMIISTTAAGYIFNIYTDHAEDAVNYQSDYLVFRRDAPHTVPIMLLFYLVSNLCALQAGWLFVLFNVVQQLLGCLYSAPIRLGARTIRIKEVPFLKNVYAAIFWSFALMLTPYVYAQQPVTPAAWIFVVVFFGMSYFVELSWDLRDMPGDAAAGVRTLPLVMGERFALGLLSAVHAITCGLAIWAWAKDILPWPYAAVYAVNLPVGIAYLKWYAGVKEKTLGSHLYVIWLGLLFSAGIAMMATTK
jgi:4-hydroxybenzoate polyprenyltransferase